MDPAGLITIAIAVIFQRSCVYKIRDGVPAGASSMMAALGFALLKPFHRLSRRAFSLGDSKYLVFSSDPPLRLLVNEMPLDLGRGRGPGEVGVAGPWSMLAMKSDTEWVCNLLQRSRGMCRARYSDKATMRTLIATVVPASECTPFSDDNGEMGDSDGGGGGVRCARESCLLGMRRAEDAMRCGGNRSGRAPAQRMLQADTQSTGTSYPPNGVGQKDAASG